MQKTEWNETRFGDVATLVRDAWRPGDESIKYVGLEHIAENELKLIETGVSDALESNKFRFRRGDILFGKLRPYFRKVVVPDFDGVCSTDIWVIRANDGYNQRFLFYFVANPAFIAQSTGASTGTKMPRADWNYLSSNLYSFPSLDEQKEIAAVLSSLDDKIELLRKQNETLEQIARTLFNEWFVRKMVGGDIPEGWTTEGLSDIADFLNGIALQKYPATDPTDYLPAVKIKELNTGITDATDKVSKQVPEKYIVRDGDVLFSWSGSLEVVIWQHGEGALNQHLFKVSSEKYPKWFYYFWLLYHLPSFRSIAANKATTMGHIQRFHLDQARVLVPDDQTLKEMDATIAPIFEKLIMNNVQINSLVILRDTLLPKLMSGEIRAETSG